MGTWGAFEAWRQRCHGECGDDMGWQRLMADLVGRPTGRGRLTDVLSRPVGDEPQWPVQRLDALWLVAHGGEWSE